MGRVLVVQMARIGDFLQTTPLLHKLKTAGCEVHVVTDSSLQELVRGCPDIDRHFALDLKSLDHNGADLRQLYRVLHEQCNELSDMAYDALYNLNYSFLSAAIAELPKSHAFYGYALSGDRKKLMRSTWFAFFNAMVQHRSLAPYNLVDVFHNLAQQHSCLPEKLSYTIPPALRACVADMLKRVRTGDVKKIIAVQLSTRHVRRQWQLSSFVTTAHRLLDNPEIALVLTGAVADKTLGNTFLRMTEGWVSQKKERILNLIGTTTLTELAAVLEQCDLMLTGDTGSMHVAAAVDTPIVALFLGPANPHWTGPYGKNHIVLQALPPCTLCTEDSSQRCDFSCSRLITPDLVVASIEQALYRQPFPEIDTSKVRVLRSTFDAYGIRYEDEGNAALDARSAWYRMMGAALLNSREQQSPSLSSKFQGIPEGTFAGIEYRPEVLLQQIKVLFHASRQHPSAVLPYRFDEKFCWWHPWIDFYELLQHYGMCTDQSAHAAFTVGLCAAAQALQYPDKEKQRKRIYEH